MDSRSLSFFAVIGLILLVWILTKIPGLLQQTWSKIRRADLLDQNFIQRDRIAKLTETLKNGEEQLTQLRHEKTEIELQFEALHFFIMNGYVLGEHAVIRPLLITHKFAVISDEYDGNQIALTYIPRDMLISHRMAAMSSQLREVEPVVVEFVEAKYYQQEWDDRPVPPPPPMTVPEEPRRRRNTSPRRRSSNGSEQRMEKSPKRYSKEQRKEMQAEERRRRIKELREKKGLD